MHSVIWLPAEILIGQVVTVDDECRSAAASLSDHIASHAGIVSRVGESSLLDDQVMIDGNEKVRIQRRVNELLILQPVHLWHYGKSINPVCMEE